MTSVTWFSAGPYRHWEFLHLLYSCGNDSWNHCHVPHTATFLQGWNQQPSCSLNWRNSNCYANSVICDTCNWFSSTLSTGASLNNFNPMYSGTIMKFYSHRVSVHFYTSKIGDMNWKPVHNAISHTKEIYALKRVAWIFKETKTIMIFSVNKYSINPKYS